MTTATQVSASANSQRTPVMCCGANHATPFCPNCGRKLGAVDPLAELATMLRRKIASFREKIKNPATTRAGNPLTAEQIEKAVGRSRNELTRHQAWLKSVLVATGIPEDEALKMATDDEPTEADDDSDDI